MELTNNKMKTIIYPSSLTRSMRQIFKNKSNERPVTKMVNGEEQTYCNACGLYTEIVSYNEDIDFAVCGHCKGTLKAKLDQLIASVASMG
jgi:hypothetical protein